METITKPAPKLNRSLLGHLLVLLAFVFLCSLGFWQLERAKQKEVLVAQKTAAALQTPLNAAQLIEMKDYAAIQYSPVYLQGYFDTKHAILLDNKTKNGVVGYQLYLPFLLNADTLILIDRGFVPAGTNRAQLPTFPAETGEVTIEGYCDFAYRNPFIRQAIESTQIEWPLRVQQVDTEQLSRISGKKIIPVLVESKLIREFPVSPSRHRGYAMQWFGLAIALGVVYFFFKRHKGAQ